MKTLDVGEATAVLASYPKNPHPEPVILTHNGKPLAVLLPVRNADVETISLSLDPRFLAIIEQSKKSLLLEGGFSSEEIRREFGLPPAPQRKPKVPRKRSNRKKDGSQV
jgi:hypothetical protein